MPAPPSRSPWALLPCAARWPRLLDRALELSSPRCRGARRGVCASASISEATPSRDPTSASCGSRSSRRRVRSRPVAACRRRSRRASSADHGAGPFDHRLPQQHARSSWRPRSSSSTCRRGAGEDRRRARPRREERGSPPARSTPAAPSRSLSRETDRSGSDRARRIHARARRGEQPRSSAPGRPSRPAPLGGQAARGRARRGAGRRDPARQAFRAHATRRAASRFPLPAHGVWLVKSVHMVRRPRGRRAPTGKASGPR